MQRGNRSVDWKTEKKTVTTTRNKTPRYYSKQAKSRRNNRLRHEKRNTLKDKEIRKRKIKKMDRTRRSTSEENVTQQRNS